MKCPNGACVLDLSECNQDPNPNPDPNPDLNPDPDPNPNPDPNHQDPKDPDPNDPDPNDPNSNPGPDVAIRRRLHKYTVSYTYVCQHTTQF